MNIENYKNVLKLIHESIISEGGDGDAIWLSKYRPIDELIPLIEEYSKENKLNWIVEKHHNQIMWGTDQEWAIITNDESILNSAAKWIILKIDY